MKPFRRTIVIMPFLSPEALPAPRPYSRVVIIPPHGCISRKNITQITGSLNKAGQKNLV